MFATVFPKGSHRFMVASNTVSQLFGRMISVGMMAIVSVMIAQRFGPSGYGDFVKITTFSTFFYTLSDFGLNAIYLQRALRDNDIMTETRGWQHLLGLRIVLGACLTGASLFVLALLPHGSNQGYTGLVRLGIVLLAPVTIVQAVTTTTNAWFQKLLRYDLATKAQNIGSLVTLMLAGMFFVYSHVQGPIIGVIAIFGGSICTAIVSLYLVRAFRGVILPLFDRAVMIREFRFAVPLGLTLIFNLIYFHSDSVILTLTRSTHEVGIYGLAYKVFELPLVLPIFFMNSVYPLLLQSKKNNSRMPDRIFWQSIQFLFGSSFIIVAVLWACAPLLTFVRPDFIASIMPLRILLLSLPIFFVSALFMWVLIAQNQQRQLLIIHSLAMALNIGLNIIFIPRFGYVAAAWITGMSELFILVVSGLVLYQKFQHEKGDA